MTHFQEYLKGRYDELDISSPDDIERLAFATKHVNAMQIARQKGMVKHTVDDALLMMKYIDQDRREGERTYMSQRVAQFLSSAIRLEALCLSEK